MLALRNVAMLLAASAAAVMMAACGWQTPVAPVPPDASAVLTTEAQAAVLEERDDSGVLVWRVTAVKATEHGGRVDCESVTLEASGDSGAPSASGTRIAVGLRGVATHGRVLSEDGETRSRVVLESGFVVRLDNGWTVEGISMVWDGDRIVAQGTLAVNRAGIRMFGHSAVIYPRGTRIRMHDVRGTIEGLAI